MLNAWKTKRDFPEINLTVMYLIVTMVCLLALTGGCTPVNDIGGHLNTTNTSISASTVPAVSLFDENLITDFYERAIPAVVRVNASSENGDSADSSDYQVWPPTYTSQGSGFFFDGGEYILTNFHVVEGANNIEIVFYDGTTTDAKLVGHDGVPPKK